MGATNRLTYWSLRDATSIYNFQTDIKATYLEHFLWICPRWKVMRHHWWLFNIGSGNGFVRSKIKPLPESMLAKFHNVIKPQ